MGNSQAAKAAHHEQIVKTASRRMRRDGIDGVSVTELMNDVGLTHGGFYRHFESRDDLVTEAISAALTQGAQRIHDAAGGGGPQALATIIDGYLSTLHRDRPDTGCAVAAVPTDIARADPRARAAYSRQVLDYLAVIIGLSHTGDPDEGHLILAALVGAIALARAVDDRDLSDEILTRTARALHRHLDDTPQA